MAEEQILISQSNLCRLCCTENSNGIDLFTEDENFDCLYKLVNRYLPLEIVKDDLFPKTICSGCHIQLESTKMFMDLIIKGQSDLRNLIKFEQQKLLQKENMEEKLNEILKGTDLANNVETYTIQSEDNGDEKYIIQIFSDASLFSKEHELVAAAEGPPKRKRGRPPKSVSQTNQMPTPAAVKEIEEVKEQDINSVINEENADPDTKRKRRIRTPVRYKGTVQGKEFDNICNTDKEIEHKRKTKKEIIQLKEIESDKIEKIDETDGERMHSDNSSNFNKRKKSKVISNKLLKTTNKNKYVCKYCPKTFSHIGRLQFHQKRHKIIHRCEVKDCDFQSIEECEIEAHKKEIGHVEFSLIEPVSTYKDATIIRELADISSNCIKTDSGGKATFKCGKCEKTLSSKQNFTVHYKAVHAGYKPFQCDKCPSTFAYACSLKTHRLSHTDIREMFQCDFCERQFNYASSLKYHEETEHGTKNFRCTQCKKTFKHRQLLQRHQSVHSDSREFKCDLCSQSFKTNHNLIVHKTTHTGEKIHECPKCHKTFRHKTSLTTHMNWHEGLKPFLCDFCHKTFSQKNNLLEHRRIHTGEKPYSCEICKAKFTTCSQYKIHLKKHFDTVEKPYQCEICKARFQLKGSYSTHMRKHFKPDTFKCRYNCGKMFPQKWACLRHEKIHVKQNLCTCSCGKTLYGAANLFRHKTLNCPLNRIILNEKSDTDKQNQLVDIPIVVEDNIQNINIAEIVEDSIIDINSASIEINELIDNEGNVINFTIPEGESISIITTAADDTEQLQGVMPDGTVVNLDILPQEIHIEDEVSPKPQMNLLTDEIQYTDANCTVEDPEMVAEVQTPFISEDGQICFITPVDENSFIFN